MVKYLIATHGLLANGFKSAINVLMGEEIAKNVSVINAFVEDGTDNPKADIEEICLSLKENETLIIMTDIMYGSVNQYAMPYVNNKSIFALTGINFPLIIETISKFTFNQEETVTIDIVQEIAEKAKEQIICINHLESNDEKQEDFFG